MLTTVDLQQMTNNKEKITMLTAYDYPSAKQAEKAGVDVILVGDSLGMVVLGYESTTEVTIDDMIHHAKAVRRGAPNTFVVVDMPFMSYHASIESSIKNAFHMFQQTKAQALKLEGASEDTIELTKKLTDGGIPIVGHLGLTPQLVNVFGGYKVQGNSEQASKQLLEDAKKMEKAGAISIVLECIPKELAEIITKEVTIPIIGIGAGVHCDGQVLVYHDILKYGTDVFPKFVKHFGNFDEVGVKGIKQYVLEVKESKFPQLEHTYEIKSEHILPKK